MNTKKILIIEDDSHLASQIAHFLESWKYETAFPESFDDLDEQAVISGAQATVVRVICNTLPVFEATLFRPLGNTLPVSPATLVRSISNTCSLNRQHLHLKNV